MCWAHENGVDLQDEVHVVYCDTGWAAPGWAHRVQLGEDFARSLGFAPQTVSGMTMAELVRMKDGFPGNGQQFCTGFLKGLPFLKWIDEIDPYCAATVMIGKRRAESKKRANTPEFTYWSEYHGERTVWHPLYLHSDADRNALLARYGVCVLPQELVGKSFDEHDRIYVLPHRSMECSPCVNANRGDFMMLTPNCVQKVSSLEVEIGRPMFRPKRFNAVGIHGVMMWAKFGKNNAQNVEDDSGCDALFGCGL